MPDGKFPVAVIGGVPVVAAPAEMDITNADREVLHSRPSPRMVAAASERKEVPLPKTSRYSLPAGELPGTLRRSPKEAQEMFARALASAIREYGESDQAYRAAYAEFKRTFEKRGDHWIPKQDQPC